MGISCSSLNFEDTIIKSKKRDIKSTTTKIKDKYVLFTLTFLIKSVSNSCCGRFVNNTEDIETSNGTSILSSLSLRIIEISRNSDDCILNGLSEESFSNFLHLDKDHRRNFFSLEFFSFTFMLNYYLGLIIDTRFDFKWPEFHILLDNCFVEFSTNESLSIKDSVSWVSCCLILSCITNESFTFSEGNV